MPLAKITLLAVLAAFFSTSAYADGVTFGGGTDCQNIPSPQTMCQNYGVDSLASDQNVQKARPSCEAFYKSVAATLNVFCHYSTDQRVTDSAAKLTAVEDSGKMDLSYADTRDTLSQSSKILQEYIQNALALRDKMDSAAADSKAALGTLAEKAEAVQKSELDCEGSGTPGAAVGVMTVGLAKYSLEEQLDTQAQLDRQIHIFTVRLNGTAHLFNGRAAAMNALVNKSVTAGNAPAATPTAGAQTPAQLAQAGVPQEQGFLESRKDLRDKAGEKAVDKGLGRVAEDELERMAARGAVMDGLKGAALKAVPIAGVAAFDILTASKRDALTFFKIGALAAVSAISSSAVVAIGAGLAADYIENKIRNQWIKDDIKIIQPYVDFLKAHPVGSSTDAAANYKGEKAQADYCKKCGPADMGGTSPYCPARNKYNPNWWSEQPLPCPADGPNAGKVGCPQKWNTSRQAAGY